MHIIHTWKIHWYFIHLNFILFHFRLKANLKWNLCEAFIYLLHILNSFYLNWCIDDVLLIIHIISEESCEQKDTNQASKVHVGDALMQLNFSTKYCFFYSFVLFFFVFFLFFLSFLFKLNKMKNSCSM